MRVRPWLACLALAAALGACHQRTGPGANPSAQVALAQETPPASGFWVQRVSDHRRILVTRYCLGDDDARKLAAFGRQLADACRRHDIAQAADGSWRFSTVCGAGSVATDGVAHGDFARHYQVEAMAQPPAGRAVRVRADISWQGACPKSLRPGDIVWPDGRRTRLAGLTAPS